MAPDNFTIISCCRTALTGMLALAALSGTVHAETCRGQIADLNHLLAVIDRKTADAVPNSALLRKYASMEVRKGQITGRPAWVGRYIYGTRNYLELFGPGDSGDGSLPGSLGLAIGGDTSGVTSMIGSKLTKAGFLGEVRMARRTLSGHEVDWFSSVRIAKPLGYTDVPSIKAWTVEFQPAFFAASDARHSPSSGPDDTVSRRRYLSVNYKESAIREISAIYLAVDRDAYRHDWLPLLDAAGFCRRERRNSVDFQGGETAIHLRFVKPARTRLERVDFTLAAPIPKSEHETIGNSSLRIGPGEHAQWLFR